MPERRTSQTTLADYLKCLADDHGWELLYEKDWPNTLRWHRSGVWLDIWLPKMTVGLTPPGRRRSRCFRYVPVGQLVEMFKRPNLFLIG